MPRPVRAAGLLRTGLAVLSGADTPRPAGRAARSRIRLALLGAIGLLYAASIPWYRAPEATPRMLLGFPDWVAVSIGCYVAIAILNAIAWLLTEVADAPPADAGPRAGPLRDPRTEARGPRA